MKNVQLLTLFVALVLGLAASHRHHLKHHGRHHEEGRKHHEEGRKHHGHHAEDDVAVTLADLSTPKNETISIDVTRKTTGPNNQKTTIRVSLRIHAIKGSIHINGQKVDHTVVTSLHVRTIIEEVSPNNVVVRKPAIVQVRVMVSESVNANGMRMLAVQEEIVEVADNEVDQIEVQELVIECGKDVQEKKRSITVIKLSHSKIHKLPRKSDKHSWARKGKVPKDPFCVSKHEMRRWKHKHMRPPTFELGRNGKGKPHYDGDDDDDDDDDDDNDESDDDRKHHRKHHHHNWGRRFCRWFHKLPVATRAAFAISVILFGILIMAACWTCCCRKPKAKPEAKYELGDTASVDVEFDDPLHEKKKPLDEQPLVA